MHKQRKAGVLLQQKNHEILAKNAALQEAQEEIRQQTEEVKQLNEVLNEVNTQITHSYDELHKKNIDMIASMNAAKRIQDAMLPFFTHISQSFSDYFLLFMPRDIVSGDFYWFMDKGDKVVLAVADCTGHGIPGAFMSMIGMNILDEIVNTNKVSSPDKILFHLHKQIHYVLNHQETEAKEGMDICMITLYKNELNQYSKLEYAGAMNPLYYVQHGQFHEFKATKRAIGGQLFDAAEREYKKQTLQLDVPTTIYLCTDGYQDQFGDKKNKKFMTRKLKELFHTIHHLPLAEQEEILSQTFVDWKGQEKQVDDVTIFGLRL